MHYYSVRGFEHGYSLAQLLPYIRACVSVDLYIQLLGTNLGISVGETSAVTRSLPWGLTWETAKSRRQTDQANHRSGALRGCQECCFISSFTQSAIGIFILEECRIETRSSGNFLFVSFFLFIYNLAFFSLIRSNVDESKNWLLIMIIKSIIAKYLHGVNSACWYVIHFIYYKLHRELYSANTGNVAI